jgi:multidrug efflux pump
MFARFFIDRPIFAMVVSIVITLAGTIALFSLPIAQYPQITPPSVSVSISYPGASADVVAQTVAAPIEQSVNGVQGMLYMSSTSGSDGSYGLSVTFEVGTNLNTALVMVQNRVTLAMPLLPSSVQNQGITIRKKTPDQLMIISLYTEDKNYTNIDLSNFALINLKDELLRVDGVADVSIMGEKDYSIRVWLDPEKLAARNLTAIDVVNAVRNQSVPVAAGQIGQPPAPKSQSIQLPIDMLSRLSTPEQFGQIIIKATPGGSSSSSSAKKAAPAAASTSTQSASGFGRSSGAGVKIGGTSNALSTVLSTGTSSGAATGGGGSTGGGASTGGAASSSGGATPSGFTAPGMSTGASSSSANGLTAASTVQGGSTGSPTTSDVLTSSALSGSGASGPSPGIVRLKDVIASPRDMTPVVRSGIELGALNYNQYSSFDSKDGVGLSVYQLPGTNALTVADKVRAKIKEMQPTFPDWVQVEIGYDTTPYVRESVADVINTLFLAVALVGVVVLLFLQDWRAMILPMIDVPVSLIGTFAVMAVMGYSLNNISLFGLVLAIGIVVDDAIVVLENIERQLAKGLKPKEATIAAMDEITGPILAITLVLCAVFVPCAFISGITGRFFRQFAVTISASMVISAVNALTLTPSRAYSIFRGKEDGERKEESDQAPSGTHPSKEALPWWFFGLLGGLCTVWLRPYLPVQPAGWFALPRDPEALAEVPAWRFWSITGLYFLPGLLAGLAAGWFFIRRVNAFLGRFFRVFDRGFDGMTTLYDRIVRLMLRASPVVLLLYGGLLALTVWVFLHSRAGFVPDQDQGRLIVSLQRPDSTALEETKRVMDKMERIAHKNHAVAHTITNSGNSATAGANAPNYGSMFVILTPFGTRPNAGQVKAELQEAFDRGVTEGQVIVNGAAPIPGLSVAGGFKLMVEDRAGLTLDVLQQQTEALITELKKQPGLEPKLTTTLRSATPQLLLDIDRDKVEAMGVPLSDVNQTLQIYLGSSSPNDFNAFGRHWQVTLQASGEFRSEIDDINRLEVRNGQGQMIPLGALVKVRPQGGPLSVQRYNLYTAAAVMGTPKKGYSTGEIIADVEEAAGAKLPLGMGTEWTELMYLQIHDGNTTVYVFGLAVLCVFLALAALYESWTMPLAVILVVPLCVLSALLGTWMGGGDLDIFVQIGLVVLVGLACKNAILVVEFAQQLHREGKSRFDAAMEASRLRLRPILMTSFAFIMGVFPLIVASGAGAEMRRSLGTAVFSGMIGVTLFGIFLTPVFFYVIQGVGESSAFASPFVRKIGSVLIVLLVVLGFPYLVLKIRGEPFPSVSTVIVSVIVDTVVVFAVMSGQYFGRTMYRFVERLDRRLTEKRDETAPPPPASDSRTGENQP